MTTTMSSKSRHHLPRIFESRHYLARRSQAGKAGGRQCALPGEERELLVHNADWARLDHLHLRRWRWRWCDPVVVVEKETEGSLVHFRHVLFSQHAHVHLSAHQLLLNITSAISIIFCNLGTILSTARLFLGYVRLDQPSIIVLVAI